MKTKKKRIAPPKNAGDHWNTIDHREMVKALKHGHSDEVHDGELYVNPKGNHSVYECRVNVFRGINIAVVLKNFNDGRTPLTIYAGFIPRQSYPQRYALCPLTFATWRHTRNNTPEQIASEFWGLLPLWEKEINDFWTRMRKKEIRIDSPQYNEMLIRTARELNRFSWNRTGELDKMMKVSEEKMTIRLVDVLEKFSIVCEGTRFGKVPKMSKPTFAFQFARIVSGTDREMLSTRSA